MGNLQARRKTGGWEIGNSDDRVIRQSGEQKTWPWQVRLMVRCSSDLRISRCLRNDSFAHGVQDQLGEAMQVEFVLEVPAVRFDRVKAEVKKGRNILIGFAFR